MKQLKRNNKCFLPVITFVLSVSAYAQPGITGKYIAYNTDTSHIIIVRLNKDSIGYHCTYDLPLGGVMNAVAKNVLLRNDTLNIYLQQPAPTIISTVVAGNGRLSEMVWKQNSQTVKLQVKPLVRPQAPQPPYPYLSDSVEYDNTDKTVHLGATFTRPKGSNKKFAVAILITGSGREDRDETVFEHRPFAVIADYLTKNGVAVLRVDDRMTGKSRGDVVKATSADFAQDVLTSLSYLKTRNDVDTNKIGLIGHSEGGIISAIAYTEWPHFAFIISLAGTGVPGAVISLHQRTDMLKGMLSKAALNAYYELDKEKFDALEKYYGNDSLFIATAAAGFDTWKLRYPDSVLNELHAKTATGALYGLQLKAELTAYNPWIRFFLHADPADYFQHVKCRVLALNGENDTQVNPVQNTTAIKTTLQKAGNNHITTLIIPRLNHLFQHCQTGQLKEYPLIEETFSAEVLTIMKNWLQKMQFTK